MNLKGKKLLILTGCNAANDIILYAKQKGVYTIASDYYRKSNIKDLADHYYNISTTDIQGIYQIAKKHKIDGIITGASESSTYTILKLAKKLNLPFYATTKQLETINDKKKLKHLLAKHSVDVTVEYSELRDIQFPVIVKPVDSSGSKGITICYQDSELKKAMNYALSCSRTNQIIIEKYLKDLPEVFANYTIINGKYSLSCLFDNYKQKHKCGLVGDAVFNIYPSKYLQKFINTAHHNIITALKSIGVKNGIISIQMLFDGARFYVYEAGYRLGGTQSYIFTKVLNNISHMEMMVNYALTGTMTNDSNLIKRDSPHFSKPCCQRNISLRAGKIKFLSGIEKIQNINGVLNVTEVRKKGDLIKKHKFKGETCLRIHVIGDTYEDLSKIIDKINTLIEVVDENNNDMVTERTSLFDLKLG